MEADAVLPSHIHLVAVCSDGATVSAEVDCNQETWSAVCTDSRAPAEPLYLEGKVCLSAILCSLLTAYHRAYHPQE